MISGSILLVLGAVGCGVDVDAVEMEVFLNPLFEAVPLLDGEGIGLCDHRDHVHKPVEVLHELHVNGTKAGGREERGEISMQENTTAILHYIKAPSYESTTVLQVLNKFFTKDSVYWPTKRFFLPNTKTYLTLLPL